MKMRKLEGLKKEEMTKIEINIDYTKYTNKSCKSQIAESLQIENL
jgi:hypothetical protein